MILAHLCLDSGVDVVHSVEVDELYRAVDVLSALWHQVSEGVVLGVVLIRNGISRERNEREFRHGVEDIVVNAGLVLEVLGLCYVGPLRLGAGEKNVVARRGEYLRGNPVAV